MSVSFPATELDITCLVDADESTLYPNCFPVTMEGRPIGAPEEVNYRSQFEIINGEVYRIIQVAE